MRQALALTAQTTIRIAKMRKCGSAARMRLKGGNLVFPLFPLVLLSFFFSVELLAGETIVCSPVHGQSCPV